MSVKLVAGYRPGAVGRLLALQIETYARDLGFGRAFEARVGADMAEFLARYDADRDLFLLALDGERMLGGITVDRGEHTPDQRLAHLRWFILRPQARGQGVGRALLTRAVDFARGHGDVEIYLWTVDALPTARHLYDQAGFVVVEELTARTWGKSMVEQKLVLRLS